MEDTIAKTRGLKILRTTVSVTRRLQGGAPGPHPAGYFGLSDTLKEVTPAPF